MTRKPRSHVRLLIHVYRAWVIDHFNSQQKLKTMLMQNFGVTNKEHYGMLWYFWSGQLVQPFQQHDRQKRWV